MKNTTLVLGASTNPIRYSFMAIHKLRNHNKKVVAIGAKEDKVLDVPIVTEKVAFDTIDTVTMYLSPKNQKEYYDYILSLQPRRVIFNPGTENHELMELLRENNIEVEVACTLVLLNLGQY
ncbi:CoA-binding protein [Tenacibaculum sp. IB213877]|uniref:CoA-binding protein n=1 Tax=Tenacibaculum sp. IB213877 TaxID=3097351 RepID=UPI002A59A13D|nr:CoA-binding protein [Tenacibaculum sp. IB213877]MDY0779751.1 CoA-binding protein [Tenacibaculum sp. IB213877]